MQIEIRPRKHFRPYLKRKQKRACLVVHRRGGKTFGCIQDLFVKALTHKRRNMKDAPLRYGYFAPTQAQAKDIAWSYIKQFGAGIGETNESELHITFPSNQGARIRLYSGENYERARGLYFDGTVLDENADMPADAWDSVIEPCLLDYDGWATFIGTPKGRNAFWRTHKYAREHPERWFSMVLKASESGIIPDEVLAELKESKNPAIYAREFECDFSADVPGAIYARWLEQARTDGRVTDYAPDPKAPFHVFMDIGGAGAQSDSTSLWFLQFVGREINVFDWYETEGSSISEDMEVIREWEVVHKRRIAALYMPHDADHKQKDSGSTLADAARKIMTCEVVVVPRIPKVSFRIDGTRDLFGRFWFHRSNCGRMRMKHGIEHHSGLDCLDNYRTKEVEEGKTGGGKPVHDIYSHSCDALGLVWEAIDNGLVIQPNERSVVFSAEVPVARTRRGVIK